MCVYDRERRRGREGGRERERERERERKREREGETESEREGVHTIISLANKLKSLKTTMIVYISPSNPLSICHHNNKFAP